MGKCTFCVYVWMGEGSPLLFFSLYVFGETKVHFRNFLHCCPSQRSAHSQVPSQVAPHQEIGSQLWAGEMPDSNPGLQDNSLARYHWATMPPASNPMGPNIYQGSFVQFNMIVVPTCTEKWKCELKYCMNVLENKNLFSATFWDILRISETVLFCLKLILEN